MSEYITAWQLKKETMNGGDFQNTVYTDHDVAKAIAKAKTEEFIDYKVHEVHVRVLNANEGAVATHLVQINRQTWSEYCRQTGLAKLTADEKVALKLK